MKFFPRHSEGCLFFGCHFPPLKDLNKAKFLNFFVGIEGKGKLQDELFGLLALKMIRCWLSKDFG